MLSKLIKTIANDYTNLVYSLIVITTFSGALRKWAGLPIIFNNLFLLIMVLIPIYMLFIFKNEKTTTLNPTIKPILLIFCFVLILLAIHPLNLTYFHGVFGIFIHLTFIAIILAYLKNQNSFNETKIVRLFFIILTTQIIISSIQYSSPPDSIINRYADNRQENIEDPRTGEEVEFVQASATVGDAVRVTGTFSYLGGYTAVVFFFMLLTFYLSKKKNIKYFFWLAPLVIFAALLSGSRGTVAINLIFILAFIFTERKLLISNPKPIFTATGTIAVLMIVNLTIGDFLGIVDKVDTAYENFRDRVESNKEESQGRLTGDLTEIFSRDFDYRYTGVGLGSTYQGTNALFGTSIIVQNTPMEGELFRILVEGGLFFLLFRWSFIIVIFRYLEIPILLKITFFLFFCVFAQNVFHLYNAIYFATGLIILNQAYKKENVLLDYERN